eukprot:506972-Pelagomonas_calceolata.AAC.1
MRPETMPRQGQIEDLQMSCAIRPCCHLFVGPATLSRPLTNFINWDLTTNAPINLLTSLMPIPLCMPTSLLPLGAVLKILTAKFWSRVLPVTL